MLKEAFMRLCNQFSKDEVLIEQLWSEIETSYAHHKRHYHTLRHLENLLKTLETVKAKISDWNALLFTLFYHDAVYTALKGDNEEKSAVLVAERMVQLGVPTDIIERSRKQILATKKHEINSEEDTNYFTDADLSVLGQDWNTYSEYAQGVRKEYSMYPDLLYKPGRRKVLQHFLSMPRIFKTKDFFEMFEATARRNLQQELHQLQ